MIPSNSKEMLKDWELPSGAKLFPCGTYVPRIAYHNVIGRGGTEPGCEA
ncbi:Chlorophyll a-b binding protein [Psidium guajava]|nr:Chlorophyll a-b binding protein [Psidium guajava]